VLIEVNKIFTEKVERELKKSAKTIKKDNAIEYAMINIRKFSCNDNREHVIN